MKEISEIAELMISLIKEVGGSCTFSDKSKAIIHDIAEYSRQRELYRRFTDNMSAFMEEWQNEKDVTAKDVYLHMLDKIVNAPTILHRNTSIILLMPIIDDLLNKNERSMACEV